MMSQSSTLPPDQRAYSCITCNKPVTAIIGGYAELRSVCGLFCGENAPKRNFLNKCRTCGATYSYRAPEKFANFAGYCQQCAPACDCGKLHRCPFCGEQSAYERHGYASQTCYRCGYDC